ncbi:MAG: phosphoglucosamine mutase, partial [Candidatus Aminicenantes bacterium]|nr:phosphoglucosamine mutase [Candidatus Aminicenantes bacterium]
MINKTKLFGTDGIRGTAGLFPLDDESIIKLGKSIGELFKGAGIIIGRDTRASGEKLQALLAAGIANKARISYCGIIPTPGLSFITDHSDFNYGIMITASHNPYQDNGIKIFNSSGEKISRDMEEKLEDIFFSLDKPGINKNNQRYPGDINSESTRYKDIYKDFLLEQAAGLRVKKQKVVVDCSHGAVYEIAPLVFSKLGLETEISAAAPDGQNINLDCGAASPGNLGKEVIARNAAVGIAFDGDGDRVIFADNRGNILDGDHSLYIISKYLLETNREFNKTAVGTIMSNLGLEKALAELGITFPRTPVGDYHVYQEMKRVNAIIGGEQSGHTILRSLQRTGDGILTALYFLEAIAYFDL